MVVIKSLTINTGCVHSSIFIDKLSLISTVMLKTRRQKRKSLLMLRKKWWHFKDIWTASQRPQPKVHDELCLICWWYAFYPKNGPSVKYETYWTKITKKLNLGLLHYKTAIFFILNKHCDFGTVFKILLMPGDSRGKNDFYPETFFNNIHKTGREKHFEIVERTAILFLKSGDQYSQY